MICAEENVRSTTGTCTVPYYVFHAVFTTMVKKDNYYRNRMCVGGNCKKWKVLKNMYVPDLLTSAMKTLYYVDCQIKGCNYFSKKLLQSPANISTPP